jgi:hypothetical protein
MSAPQRPALFISHATPEDNAVTLWLGTKLTALGYEVWADIFRLKGGDDWERILEDAIRNKAQKFLLIATPHGVQKQGVRNEVTLAAETAKKIGDPNFVLPLRMAPYESPYLIAHAQHVDFEKSWDAGLKELLEILNAAGVPCMQTGINVDMWKWISTKEARQIGPGPETLRSNWLEIEQLPEDLVFYDFAGGISLGAAQSAIKACSVPVVAHNRGFVSFAPIHQLQEHFGDNLPLKAINRVSCQSFLEKGWPHQTIETSDARRKFTDLVRQGMNAFFLGKGLNPFEFSAGKLAWWPTKNRATVNMLTYSWPGGPSGRRQLVGESKVRHVFWHYGVNCWARTSPIRHIRVGAHVVFTTDGQTLVGDPKRIHKMRRSFCKSWRNDKWRDLLLAFWHWIGEGALALDIPMGEDVALKLKLPPLSLEAPFGVMALDDHHEGPDYEEDEEVPEDEAELDPSEEDEGAEEGDE